MAKIRQQNVSAAQWSPNGAALGAPDLTQPDNQVFGENVFSVAEQRQRLPKTVFKHCRRRSSRARRSTARSPTRSRSR